MLGVVTRPDPGLREMLESAAAGEMEAFVRMKPAPDPRRPGFPANREQCREISSFPAICGKNAPKSPAIRAGSSKIPYAIEQGINSAEQGIKVPCSAENRDIARLTCSLLDAAEKTTAPPLS